MPSLELVGVHAGYGPVPVLRDVDLSVGDGEVVALLGSNGAGKTTTIKTIAGLVRPTAGTIAFGGTSIAGAPTRRVVELGVAFVPEGRRVFPALTVRENLEVAGYARHRREGRGAIRAGLERIYELFPRLLEREAQLAQTLSGGEQQMLALGRAMLNEPRLLVLDEPSLGLAPRMVMDVFRTIADIADAGTSVLLVEQNAKIALEVSDRVFLMKNGRIAMEKDAASAGVAEAVEEVYLGR